MNLKLIVKRGVNQKEKDKYHFYHIYTESRKNVLKNSFTGQQWRNRHGEQTYGHGERGGEGEMYGKSNMETYITVYEVDCQWEFAVWLRKLKKQLCIYLEVLGWRGRQEEGSKGSGYMYTYG